MKACSCLRAHVTFKVWEVKFVACLVHGRGSRLVHGAGQKKVTFGFVGRLTFGVLDYWWSRLGLGLAKPKCDMVQCLGSFVVLRVSHVYRGRVLTFDAKRDMEGESVCQVWLARGLVTFVDLSPN
ncbi:hypothetical protein PIB30_102932, partial [Stylosanthes scabra]|nr:hypothetical protein [Stylosanthes scabra]